MSKLKHYLKQKNDVLINILLLIIILTVYISVSEFRHAYNPADKIIPTLSQMGTGIYGTLAPNKSGEIIFLKDTFSSLARIALGVFLSTIISLSFGLLLGLSKWVEKCFLKSLLFLGKIPPLALLPIIFVFSGLGEFTKILLIIIGISPSMTLEIYLNIKHLSEEQLVKVQTLGTSKWTTVFKIILPQLMPVLIDAIRINIINIWVYLIAVESISATSGLGYRIFLVRRYLAMNIIIPYVIWIAILSFGADIILDKFSKHHYPWYHKS